MGLRRLVESSAGRDLWRRRGLRFLFVVFYGADGTGTLVDGQTTLVLLIDGLIIVVVVINLNIR